MLKLNNANQVSATPLKTKRADELGLGDRIVITRTDITGTVQMELCEVILASKSLSRTPVKLRVRPLKAMTGGRVASDHATFRPVEANELETITFAALDTEVTVVS